MKKNIILCADGTGNEGGYTPDSNVYKLYNAIDLHDKERPQVVFYDNGVGTHSNKYLRGLGGAFGFGLETNVQDLYEFLARNYEEGDNIYLFGFSRGAATVRAFNGFLHKVGLIKGQGKGNSQLREQTHIAFKYYRRSTASRKAKLEKLERWETTPEVSFIGAWDTVSALGFPERKHKVGIGLNAIYQVFKGLTWLFDKIIWPHKFYNYEITPNVKKACHALAIDDERTIFWPKLWKENTPDSEATEISQVWFAGVHSNIGGGYERAEIANVCFAWMLENLGNELKFKHDVLAEARENSNVHGRLYNSRDGFAAFYSYQPRDIAKLCREAGAPVNVHDSVLERMRMRTANYAPRFLPPSFQETSMENGRAKNETSPEIYKPHWDLFNRNVRSNITVQKWLWSLFIEMSLLAVVGVVVFYIEDDFEYAMDELTRIQYWSIYVLETLTPDFLRGAIKAGVADYPIWGLSATGAFGIFFWFRSFFAKRTLKWSERLRKLFILYGPEPHPNFPTDRKS